MIRVEPAPRTSGAPVPALSHTKTIPIVDSNPAVEQINAWLLKPFTVRLWYDGALIERPVLPRERMRWMRTTVEMRGLVAHLSTEGIARTLAEVNLSLGPLADMRVAEAAQQVRAALLRNEHAAWLVIPRKQLTHVAQPNQTWTQISQHYGIPLSRLLQANPQMGADADVLTEGQTLVIPAQADLLPNAMLGEALKRIEIDLSTQCLTAYEGATSIRAARIAVGQPEQPALAGMFQVLAKWPQVDAAPVSCDHWLALDEAEAGYSRYGIHTQRHVPNDSPLDEQSGSMLAGSIALAAPDCEWLYMWADVGTPVIIYAAPAVS
jgi:LysM repeat protein